MQSPESFLAVLNVLALPVLGGRVHVHAGNPCRNESLPSGQPLSLVMPTSPLQGILLVYDITNRWSFDGIDRWIKEIDEVGIYLQTPPSGSPPPCGTCSLIFRRSLLWPPIFTPRSSVHSLEH